MRLMNTLSPQSRSVFAAIGTGAVLLLIITMSGESGADLGKRSLAAACSTGSFWFTETCKESTDGGSGCRTTTQCKKSWWGWGKKKCTSETICAAPVAHSASASTAASENAGALTCPASFPTLCGGTSCVPSGTVCCASAGFPDRYCGSGSFCTINGQCESTTGGTSCLPGYNSPCQAAANSCGMQNSGTISCTGSCQAVTPADSSCPVPNINLTKSPALFVNPGETCTLTWTTSNTTGCSLVNLSSGTDVASGKNGSYVTPPLSAQTDFRLTCQNGTVVSGNREASCSLNPAFIEE